MTKYTGYVYESMTLERLKNLRSKKYLRVMKFKGMQRGWYDEREYDTLLNQIHWIDAEIESRRLPMKPDLK